MLVCYRHDMKKEQVDLCVIGSGPAGYSAAIYGARAGLSTVVATGMSQGGQLTITTDVDNYPGFADTIQGPWLMEQMVQQVTRMGVRVHHETIVEVALGSRPFVVRGDGGHCYEAGAVIIATGALARWLGLPSEEMFKGFGVSACATCDGFLFKGEDLAVVGGGNTAVEEALYLTNHAKKVTLIHRRDALRADHMLAQRLMQHPAIELLWNHEVVEVLGETEPHKKVTGLRLKNCLNGSEKELSVAGLFVAIGHDPATDLFKGQIDLDDDGIIRVTRGGTATSIGGVFAAGDVCDRHYRQAITAAGMGCMAALDAYNFLSRA